MATAPTIYVTDDTHINSGDPAVNYETSAIMRTGEVLGTYTQRVLMRFDLSSIPANAIIKTASMKIDTGILFGGSSVNISMSFYTITAAWNVATVTWNNQPAINASAYGTTTVPDKPAHSYTTFNAKTLIEAMRAGGYDSFEMRETVEGTAGDILYVYSENLAGSAAYLDITYELPSKVNVGDAWKPASDMKVNVGDAWKSASGMKVNIGDAWKEVF